MLETAERPGIIVGNGGRLFADEILALAERINAPVITTFKAKGTIADDHPVGLWRAGPQRDAGGQRDYEPL